MSEALILESVNPQYGKWLLTESPEKYKFRTCCVHELFWMSKQKTKKQFLYTTCSELGIFMYWTGNSMNNLLWYCGLVDTRISASDKDLPVTMSIHNFLNSLLPKKYKWDLPFKKQFLKSELKNLKGVL